MPFPSTFAIGQTFATPAGRNVRVDSVIPLVLTATAMPSPNVNAVSSTSVLDERLLQNVISVGSNTPPAHVAAERHVVGTAPTGDWAGHANQIAESNGSSWAFIVPWTGLRVSTGNPPTVYTFTGFVWVVGNTTTNTTVAMTDGDYGDVVVSNNGTRMVLDTSLTQTVTNNVTNNITNNSANSLEWFSQAGFASLTGPSQYAVFPNSAPIPKMPSSGRLWVDINVTGLPFDSTALELQVSFDDGTTWALTSGNGTGIPCDGRLISPGVSVMPLETLTQPADYLWFETAPSPTPTGLKYRWQTQGFYDVVSSGPIALRLHSKGWMPAGTTVSIIGVHFK